MKIKPFKIKCQKPGGEEELSLISEIMSRSVDELTKSWDPEKHRGKSVYFRIDSNDVEPFVLISGTLLDRFKLCKEPELTLRDLKALANFTKCDQALQKLSEDVALAILGSLTKTKEIEMKPFKLLINKPATIQKALDCIADIVDVPVYRLTAHWDKSRTKKIYALYYNGNAGSLLEVACTAEMAKGLALPEVTLQHLYDLTQKPEVKYQVIEPDYRGCDPRIAKILKTGKHVNCSIPESKDATIVNFSKGYYLSDLGNHYRTVAPLPVKPSKQLYVLEKKALVQALLDHDFLPDSQGLWVKGIQYLKEILNFAGCIKSELPESAYRTDWMLEEK